MIFRKGEFFMSDYKKEGVDISYCQPKVDWTKVDCDFCIIKAGQRNYTDNMYESHYKNAKAKGMNVGAYWFLDKSSLTVEAAEKEADEFLKRLKGKQFDYPVFLDIEYTEHYNLGKSLASAMIRAFLQKVESAGYWVGLYTNLSWLTCIVEDDIKTRYAIWLAQWAPKPTYTGAYGLWQTGAQNMNGFPDKVDHNYCYVDYPTKIKAKGLNGYPKPSPTPTPPKPEPKLIPYPEGFTPMLQIPEKGNPYYNTIGNGGYSTCIIGKPTQEGLNTLSNCVGLSVDRFNEIIGAGKFVYLNYPPNGEDVYARAIKEGLEVSQEPSYGAILCFAKGKTGDSSDGAGHVATVEQMFDDGSIVTAESGYKASRPFWTTKRTNADGHWGGSGKYTFLGFVKNPKLYPKPVPPTPTPTPTPDCPYTEPTKAVKEGSTDKEGVMWMQWYLTELGYYDDDITGIFEIITLGALLAFQFKNGLDVDGSCGAATRQALKDAYAKQNSI